MLCEFFCWRFFILLLWGLYEALSESPAVVGSVLAVVVGFISSQVLQSRVENEKILEMRRAKLAPIAEEFFKFVRRSANGGDELDSEDKALFARFQDELLLWGSKTIVEEWARFMRVAESNPSPRVAVDAYMRVIHAIRKELGRKDEGLAYRDLLRLFMVDADHHFGEHERF